MLAPVITSAVGIFLILCGVLYPAYVIPDGFYNRNDRRSMIFKQIKMIEDFIAPSPDRRIYKALVKLISIFEVQITVQRLWLYKILSIVLSFSVLTIVSATNTNITKQNIMGAWWQDAGLMDTITPEEYKYNVILYNDVLKRTGKDNFKKITDDEKIKRIIIALHDIKGESSTANGRAEAFISAYKKIEDTNIITLNIVLSAVISFFIPEILLFMRKIVIGRKYRNEAIKMENIFGLLGSMEEYKTIYIIKDMAAASKLFKRQLEHAAVIFYTDKNKSFDYLKTKIKEKSFIRLVDIMRIYSTVDKSLAMSILERNIKEHEEQLLLNAEEDMDVVDILAFISIVPILYEIADLMLSPMLEVVFKVFNFV